METLKNPISTARELKKLGINDIREALEMMELESADFEVNCFRFIHKDDIDRIQQEELLADEYILGCFNAWFIADIIGESTGLTCSDIEEMQKDEQYEALGRIMSKHIEEVQDSYASADGYGHYFNHVNGNEYEIGDYYIFDC